MEARKAKSVATKLERYARKNIPERSSAYGQFMYHAELLRRGHVSIHRQDMKDLPIKYQGIVKEITSEA